MRYEAILLVPSRVLRMINGYLNAETPEAYQSEDSTLLYSVRFPDGMVADIKCCGSQDGPSWTEAVLFIRTADGGLYEVTCSEPEDCYEGEWEFSYDGTTYSLMVADGGELEAARLIPAAHNGHVQNGWSVDNDQL